MSVPCIFLSSWLSVCQKLSNLVEIVKVVTKRSWAIFWHTLYSILWNMYWKSRKLIKTFPVQVLNKFRHFMFIVLEPHLSVLCDCNEA